MGAALKLPVTEQHRVFDAIRKNGIYTVNVERKVEAGDNADLIRERRQGGADLVMCSGCRGFYSKTRIYKHKKLCYHSAGLWAEGVDFTSTCTRA